jgi:hypothetical protein
LSSDQYDEWTLALSIANLTLALLLQDRGERAAPLLVEGLLLSERLGFREITSCCLERVAALTAKDEPELACKLLGAAEALNDDLGMLGEPAEERLRENTLMSLAPLVASESIMASRQAGRRMSSQQAVAEALDALQS